MTQQMLNTSVSHAARRAAMACAIGLTLAASTAGAGSGTRVSRELPTRLFVMAGFSADCGFKGYPEMQIVQAPAKGQVSFKPGEATTIQYSLSGNCIGQPAQGIGIYYMPADGHSGEDTFTVSGQLGSGEPATRTFSVIIDEQGAVQE
jgi:hypothetical protein